MKPIFVSIFIALCVLSSGQGIYGQSSVTQYFDPQKTTVLKGTIVEVDLLPGAPHAFIVLRVTDQAGKTENWAIEGNAAQTLREAGLRVGGPTGILKLGDQVTIATLLPKPNAKLAESLPAPTEQTASTIKQLTDLINAGRFVHGTQLTLSDGKTFVFGDSK